MSDEAILERCAGDNGMLHVDLELVRRGRG